MGTREGDIHILDADGAMHFSHRQDYDVSQIYFGEKRCFVATLSQDLYEFSAARLDNIGLMSMIRRYSVWAIAALAVLTLIALIVAFPKSRTLGARFFRSMYRHRTAYLMLLPSIVLILIFNYYNVFQAFYYAFTDWSLSTRTMREVKFIGFDNFVKMITEGYFLLGVKNLVIMMIASFLKLLTVRDTAAAGATGSACCWWCPWWCRAWSPRSCGRTSTIPTSARSTAYWTCSA